MPKATTKYIDAFVLVVPKKHLAKYRKMARDAAKVWTRHGALRYTECIGDDLKPDMGGQPYLPFPKMTKMKPSDTVWFSYIEYKSKAHRNSVNKKVNAEFMEKYGEDIDCAKDMPWDMQKFCYGGFKVAVSA